MAEHTEEINIVFKAKVDSAKRSVKSLDNSISNLGQSVKGAFSGGSKGGPVGGAMKGMAGRLGGRMAGRMAMGGAMGAVGGIAGMVGGAALAGAGVAGSMVVGKTIADMTAPLPRFFLDAGKALSAASGMAGMNYEDKAMSVAGQATIDQLEFGAAFMSEEQIHKVLAANTQIEKMRARGRERAEDVVWSKVTSDRYESMGDRILEYLRIISEWFSNDNPPPRS